MRPRRKLSLRISANWRLTEICSPADSDSWILRSVAPSATMNSSPNRFNYFRSRLLARWQETCCRLEKKFIKGFYEIYKKFELNLLSNIFKFHPLRISFPTSGPIGGCPVGATKREERESSPADNVERFADSGRALPSFRPMSPRS